MRSTFLEFPEDDRRTEQIKRAIRETGAMFPVFIEQGDESLFIMEGRHRIVAFYEAGMQTVPVFVVSELMS